MPITVIMPVLMYERGDRLTGLVRTRRDRTHHDLAASKNRII